MKRSILCALLAFVVSLPLYSQLAKCKGKYLGNVIGSSVPKDYTSLWNQATSENGSKWGVIESIKGQYDWTVSDAAYLWAKENDGLFKFHTLVWSSQAPEWTLTESPAELKLSIENFIKAVAAHYGPMGGLDFIDVFNEPVHGAWPANMKAALYAGYKAEPANAKDINNPYGWVIWPFQLARKYFPEATLLINEYNMEKDWDGTRPSYIAFANAVKKAPNLTDGAKNLIDGVGIQCHGIFSLTATEFTNCINEIWNGTGLPVHITEMDQAADADETKQKNVYATLIPVAWEHPHVAGITLWGYIQGETWITGNGKVGPQGTDSGLQYASSYTANPGGDRPALAWMRQYFAGRVSLSCCPSPGSTANCAVGSAPTASVSAPADASLYFAPASIAIAASAADADGSISKVRFYNGSVLLARDTEAPFSFIWTDVAPGKYSITAVATDNSGKNTVSKAVSVQVAVAPKNNVFSHPSSDLWTNTANWSAGSLPASIDTAVIRMGEARAGQNFGGTVKVEPSGILRLIDSISVPNIRLQGGMLKSYTSTPVFVLISTVTVEKPSVVMAGSLAASTFRIDGILQGSGSITKTGIGTLQINAYGTNFKGEWIVSEGRLKLRNATALGKCGVRVMRGANLDVEAPVSTHYLVLEEGGTLALDNNITVQAAVMGGQNIPAGTYTAADFPSFLSSRGTLTVAATLLSYQFGIGGVDFSAQAGSSYIWTKDAAVAGSGYFYKAYAEGSYSVIASTDLGCSVESAPVSLPIIRRDTLAVALAQGWNLVSIYLLPDTALYGDCIGGMPCISGLFAGMDVREIKTMDGSWRAGQPDYLNTLHTLAPGEGFWVYMNSADTLTVAGNTVKQMAPQVRSGWHLIGCPYPYSVPFAGIFGSNILIAKDFDGYWQPSSPLGGIEYIEPGKAYFVLFE